MTTEENLTTELGKMKSALEVLGLAPSVAEEQLDKLSKIILLAILNRIAREKGSEVSQPLEPTEENITAFLQKHYDQEEIKNIIKEESAKKFEEYFTAISKNADPATLDKAIQTLSA